MEFWYPLTPTSPIREAKKRIVFEPPIEKLSGERLHQWLGARRRIDKPSDDRGRIVRQQELVAVALGEGIDFRRFIADPETVRGARPRPSPSSRWSARSGGCRRSARSSPSGSRARRFWSERPGVPEQPLDVEAARAALLGVDLAVGDHMLAVERDLPAVRDRSDQLGPDLVLLVRPGGPLRVSPSSNSMPIVIGLGSAVARTIPAVAAWTRPQ